MASWEVVAADRTTEEPVEDCREIDVLGYRVAGSVREKDVATAAIMIENGRTNMHILVNGEEVSLRPAGEGANRYVRTIDSDSPDDPLLSLPSIAEYKQQKEAEKRGFETSMDHD